MDIRLAQKRDLDEINALINVSAKELQSGFYKPSVIEEALELVTGIEALIEGKTFLVAVESEKIIGCGGYLHTQTFSELRAFFVHPEFSRKGIASKIMSKCIEYSAEIGLKQIKLVATLSGVPFYTRLGFTEVARDVVDLSSGSKFEVVEMNRVIS
jgi:N-acetylglutamate synthase-like GNAT family acetyltransferase